MKIDKVIYINLDYRTDRRAELESELERYGLKEISERFPAIRDDFGALGCAKSQLEVLRNARDRNYQRILVLEDDFTFLVSTEEFKFHMDQLDTISFDVCMLSYNCPRYEDSSYPFLKKVIVAGTASGYIVDARYYDTLIQVFQESVDALESTRIEHLYAVDVVWQRLQPSSEWYRFTTRIGKQRHSYSDITRSMARYDV